MKYGNRTSFYGQEELIIEVDDIVDRFPERWNSRSNFINAAIFRFLQEVKKSGKCTSVKTTDETRYFEGSPKTREA